MNSKPITTRIRAALESVDTISELQDERGANDIRRRMIVGEIKEIERLLIELKRRNRDG